MFDVFKDNPKEKEIIKKYNEADEYKVICGTPHEVERQINELHKGFPQYVADLFAKNEDETTICVIMKKRWTGGRL